MRRFWTRYIAMYPNTILYMLQNTDYRLRDYFSWYGRTNDFRFVMSRRTLELTKKVRLLRIGIWTMWFVVVVAAAIFIFIGIVRQNYITDCIGLVLVLILPFILAYGITIPLFVGRILIQKPREKRLVIEAKSIFEKHSGTRIAVVGSFGKTTAKEVITTLLSEGLIVASTPGNMNTPIGISRFARKLNGDEEVLIIEMGEEKVGDITELSELTRPTMGIITGINESHLSSFKTMERTIATIFELTDYLGKDAVVYKNEENDNVASQLHNDPYAYSRKGVGKWKVSSLKTSLEDGTHFTATLGIKKIKVHTKLIGLHTVGVTVAAIAVADSLGLTVEQIERGLSKIKPFEHRMEPRQLHGAWIIDDTYNGNSDGVVAGLALLRDSKANRRVYVTPGLVEQGSKTKEVHEMIGRTAAESCDLVILMKNSVTNFIVSGLEEARYKGKTLIIDEPLDFYTNLEVFVAKGDVVLMQNDWTDNYA